MNTQQLIEEALQEATVIAFDGCHKIYIGLDQGQADEFRDYGYGRDGSFLEVVVQTPAGRRRALTLLRQWWDDSCSLRFISKVRTVPENPNAGFGRIIDQFEEWA